MASASDSRPIGLLLSGGLDSCTLLAYLLRGGHRVQPFYVRSGLVWEREELLAIDRFTQEIASPRVESLVIFEVPLEDLYGEHWSVTGRDTPDGRSPDDAVYLPGRNALLLLKAALWCRLHDLDRLALAVLESNPFSDATDDFFDAFESTLEHATGGRVRILRPFARWSKRQVMYLGRNQPLGLTFSCIAPVGGEHCGQCNKCAERSAAFRLVGLDDPTKYAHPVFCLEP